MITDDDFDRFVDNLIRDVQIGHKPIDQAAAELEPFLGTDLAYSVLEGDRD